MNDERPSYYAIIPASVRYDEGLGSSAKLLYGEISSLCHEKGYCWANNHYFSKLYGVSIRSISAWIGQIEKQGHIRCEGAEKRKITLAGAEEFFQGPRRKLPPPLEENFQHNIKSNITSNKDSAKAPRRYKSTPINLVP